MEILTYRKTIISLLVIVAISLSSYIIQDASAFSFVSSVDITPNDPALGSMVWNNDGTKLVIINGDNDKLLIFLCTVSFQTDTCKADNTVKLSGIFQKGDLRGITFSSNENRMFLLSSGDKEIKQLKCSKSFNISSCSFNSTSKPAIDISSEGYSFRDLDFNEVGSKLFFIEGATNSLHQYSCTVKFTITSCVPMGQSLAIPDDWPTASAQSPDGKIILVTGNKNNMIYEYSCDGISIESCILVQTLDISSYETNIQGISFNLDGTELFITGFATKTIQTFSLNIAYSLLDEEDTQEEQNNGGGGCNDCTPPTLGVNKDGQRMVDNGIQINGETIEVDYFYTEMPMQYTEIGKNNTVSFTIYENGGPHNIQHVDFGLGVKEVGSSINESQAIFEIDMGYFKDDISNPKLDKVNLIDKDGIVGDYNVTLDLTTCIDEVQVQDVFNPDVYHEYLDCLLVEITYNYIKVPDSPVLAVNAWDYDGNTVNHYFNDGFTVIDPNPPPVEEIIIEKYTCKDPIQKVMTRNNCNFRAMVSIWDR